MKKITDIKYGNHNECLLDIYLPDLESFPVFIFFHGGGLTGGTKDDIVLMPEYLASKGIACVNANYSLYPAASYPQFIDDAAQCVAWVKSNIENYGNPTSFFVGGNSAGGYLSMMLCFDKNYLLKHNIHPTDIDGYIHAAGQPTAHFNVLSERGINPQRVIVDDSAPLYHIGTEEKYSPMLFIVSDNDMENRYEQTMLTVSTLKHFGHTEPDVKLIIMPGGHCEYVYNADENGDSIFGKIICEYIADVKSAD